ncbi:SLC13 family permease [Cesiribacter andamanensis]|uniref:Na(+)/dicarboxylate symporter n=1 Tax=Cesiribacter andamanensis AMV16 TaxID=1279009 RepID=M7NQ84_9BACT|nr:DASS family sodium-coupled anion symporter [Cesiribacter andamanensis]EMR03880.1 Na(+)/dicarboxylate symporter [Cesiribacter andamanensis AMV16]
MLGPLLFGLAWSMEAPAGMSAEAQAVLACTLWIASWWITEAIPIAVTSLLPLVLLPLTGALGLETTSASYGNPVIFLFLGGFLIALAMEEWNLHKRIALSIIALVGTNQPQMVLGFMLATGFLSMWISNTATAMMMLPIGVAIVEQLTEFTGSGSLQPKNRFGIALMLGIAYSASIGGLATLIGTPGNAIFAAIVQQLWGVEITFFRWLLLGMPLSFLLLLICWAFLVKLAYPLEKTDSGGSSEIRSQLQALGPIQQEERWIIGLFLLTAGAWISRSFLLNPLLPALDDSMIAMAAAVLLFMIPSRRSGWRQGLLTWEISRKVPWGILLLFGGGLAIAAAFKTSGLAAYIGENLQLLQTLPLLLVLLAIIAVINFLTELTSNVATATMMLPILASLSQAIGIHPFGPMVAACLASSCAFMLPVATPPNAVVFGTGYIRMRDMVKTGLWLNLISILLITLYLYLLLPLLWKLDPLEFPLHFD